MRRTLGLTRRAMLVATAVCLLVSWANESEACSCGGPIPACQAAWQAGAVFAGTVLSVQDEKPVSSPPFTSRRVRIKVTESFRGDAEGEVDVFTGSGGGDCGFDFSVAGQYLVYAYLHTPSGRLSTGICSRTKRLGSAGDDLAYLRGPARTPSSLGTIKGTAQLENPQPGVYVRSSFADARVIATGGGRSYETTTDAKGKYELSVPVGTYEIRVEVRPGQYAMPAFPRVAVIDARGCAGSDIFVRWDGRISGRLLNVRGEPVPFFPVELVAARDLNQPYVSPQHVTRTGVDGRYEFERIEPGVFHVGVNTGRRPRELPIEPRALLETQDAAPVTINLAPGERTVVGNFLLPGALEVIMFEGVVLSPDGAPKPDARVYVRLDGAGSRLLGPAVTTGADGRFAVSVVFGYQYKLVAESRQDHRLISSEDSSAIDTASPVAPITLRLRPPK